MSIEDNTGFALYILHREMAKSMFVRLMERSEVLRFILTGGLATFLHYFIYFVLLKMNVNMTIAFAIGYFISFLFNYLMSARFTFKKKASASNGAGFALAHIINFSLQTGLLNLFSWLSVPKELAPIPAYAISIPVNFIIVRFVFNSAK